MEQQKDLNQMSISELKEILFDAKEQLDMLQMRYNELRASIVPLINQKLKEREAQEKDNQKTK